ncbi:MlaE family lipid ABC transporter permease subunit [Hoeflea sp. CAU 1731]
MSSQQATESVASGAAGSSAIAEKERVAAQFETSGPEDGKVVVRLSGGWNLFGVSGIDAAMRQLGRNLDGVEVTIDLSAITAFDTSGALVIVRLKDRLESRSKTVAYKAIRQDRLVLLDAVEKAMHSEYDADDAPKQKAGLVERIFAPIGEMAYELYNDFLAMMFILGSTVWGARVRRKKSSGISSAAIFSQMDHVGVRAIPIITLMSFLIGGIIAQQGAFQLRYFGAEIFVVDLVGILQLREIGVLLTAIMIAGRSGSAITAEIGSMKMREEVDALKVMGLNPISVLVFPRLVALTIMLPLLTIMANFSALFGALLTTWIYSGIQPETFINRLREAIDYTSVASGMIKAPFMALIIGIVASVEGLKVEGSAESLGRHVTSAVVKAIFVVILVDGLFAIFYGAIDF